MRTAVPSVLRRMPSKTCSGVIRLSPTLSASGGACSSAFFALGEKGIRRSSGNRTSNASPALRRASIRRDPDRRERIGEQFFGLFAHRFGHHAQRGERLQATPSSRRRIPSRRSSSPTESWPSSLASSTAASAHFLVSLAKRVKIMATTPPFHVQVPAAPASPGWRVRYGASVPFSAMVTSKGACILSATLNGLSRRTSNMILGTISLRQCDISRKAPAPYRRRFSAT